MASFNDILIAAAAAYGTYEVTKSATQETVAAKAADMQNNVDVKKIAIIAIVVIVLLVITFFAIKRK